MTKRSLDQIKESLAVNNLMLKFRRRRGAYDPGTRVQELLHGWW
jgi:hypothetical protein